MIDELQQQRFIREARDAWERVALGLPPAPGPSGPKAAKAQPAGMPVCPKRYGRQA